MRILLRRRDHFKILVHSVCMSATRKEPPIWHVIVKMVLMGVVFLAMVFAEACYDLLQLVEIRNLMFRGLFEAILFA